MTAGGSRQRSGRAAGDGRYSVAWGRWGRSHWPDGANRQRRGDLGALTRPEALRSPWARLECLYEVLSWAADTLGATGRRVTGPAVQRKIWNLAALFRLPTDKGPVWLKTTPRFAADEASVIAVAGVRVMSASRASLPQKCWRNTTGTFLSGRIGGTRVSSRLERGW